MTPETLIAEAEAIDRRIGPISGRDADRLAVVLREAAQQIAGIRHPTGSEQFNAHLAALGVPAPWDLDEDKVGAVLAADGALVCDADTRVTDDVTDEECTALALWIIMAVNTLAGFKTEASELAR